MQPSERMGPTSRAVALRNVLVAASALVVLFMGAVGMDVLIGLRQPPPRQVIEDAGPLARVASIQPQDVRYSMPSGSRSDTGARTSTRRYRHMVLPDVAA